MKRNSTFRIAAAMLVSASAWAQAPASGAGAGNVRPAPVLSKSVRPPDIKQIRTSALRAMGWSIGIPGTLFRNQTFYDAMASADALGLSSIEAFDTQKVSAAIDKNLDPGLAPSEIEAVKARLAELRLRLPAYRIVSAVSDEAGRRRTFQFAKALGAEIVIFPLNNTAVPELDKLAGEFGINVAVDGGPDPKLAMAAIAGAGKRVGISADFGEWMDRGIRPSDAASLLGERLFVAHLRDQDALAPSAHQVPLGSGVADIQRFLMEIARLEPPIQEFPGKCTNCYVGFTGVNPLFLVVTEKYYEAAPPIFAHVLHSVEALEAAVRPAMGYRVQLDSALLPPTSPDVVPAAYRKKIEEALPHKALAAPLKRRKLLVFDLCPLGDFHHDSIGYANLAISLMAQHTHAFEPVFSNDPSLLKYPAITQFDAVLLNSTVGESYIDPDVMNGMLRFVREGGGIVGIHAATYASQNLPEYGDLMGAVDGPHRVETATIKVDDPASPLTKGFASIKNLSFSDEFYHFLPTGPYSRDKLHVLISIDTTKSDMSRWKIRPDDDYGLVWTKAYGSGRVFNCALGHTPDFFATPAFGELILGGIQFALGDLSLDVTPSALLAKTGK